jgi:hypothetical protein
VSALASPRVRDFVWNLSPSGILRKLGPYGRRVAMRVLRLRWGDHTSPAFVLYTYHMFAYTHHMFSTLITCSLTLITCSCESGGILGKMQLATSSSRSPFPIIPWKNALHACRCPVCGCTVCSFFRSMTAVQQQSDFFSFS